MYWKIFILMILCHVIGDFVLQTDNMIKLKQKSWWEEQTDDKKYKNDYKIALLMHCLLWSAMILLPVIFCTKISGSALYWMFIINAFIHYIVDDMKANYKILNLVQDQVIHLVQIFLTFLIIVFIFV